MSFVASQQWVFVQYVETGSTDKLKILIQIFMIFGDCNTIGKMRNAFVFDGRHGMGLKAYAKKSKGILMWSFGM